LSDFSEFYELDDDDDTTGEYAKAMKQYVQAAAITVKMQEKDEATVKAEIKESNREATENYNQALLANQAALNVLRKTDSDSRVELTVQRGDILQNLGDLALLQASSDLVDPAARPNSNDVINKVMSYYESARKLYSEAANPRQEGEILNKIGSVHI